MEVCCRGKENIFRDWNGLVYWAFTSVQFSIVVSGRNIGIYDFSSKRMCR
jgi:hypothetical protein